MDEIKMNSQLRIQCEINLHQTKKIDNQCKLESKWPQMNHGQSNSLDKPQPRFEKRWLLYFFILYFEIGDGHCIKITKILRVPKLEFENSRFCQNMSLAIL